MIKIECHKFLASSRNARLDSVVSNESCACDRGASADKFSESFQETLIK